MNFSFDTPFDSPFDNPFDDTGNDMPPQKPITNQQNSNTVQPQPQTLNQTNNQGNYDQPTDSSQTPMPQPSSNPPNSQPQIRTEPSVQETSPTQTTSTQQTEQIQTQQLVSSQLPSQPNQNLLQQPNNSTLDSLTQTELELQRIREQQLYFQKQQEELLKLQQQLQQQQLQNQQQTQSQPQQNQNLVQNQPQTQGQQQTQQPQSQQVSNQVQLNQSQPSQTQQPVQTQTQPLQTQSQQLQTQQPEQTQTQPLQTQPQQLQTQQVQNQSPQQIHTGQSHTSSEPQNRVDTPDPNAVWREAKAPNGRTYYYNKLTKQTTWQKPPGFTGGPPQTQQTINQGQTTEQGQQQTQPQQIQQSMQQGQQTNTQYQQNSGQVQQTTGQYPSTGSDQPLTGQNQPNIIQNDIQVAQNPDLSQTNSVSIPQPASPHKFLKVKLPNDQRQVVPFRIDQTLREVLRKICKSRPFTENDYIPRDKAGTEIGLDRTLGDINQDEISFVVPREGFTPGDETDKKAHAIMSQMLDSNASLSSTLFALLKNYRDPMLESARDPDPKKKLLTENQCNQIFSSLESIAKSCYEFKQSLSTQLEIWPVDLENMFRKHLDVIPFYKNFVNNYKEAMTTIEELRKNRAFSDFVDNIQRTIGTKLRIEDLVGLPATKIGQMLDLVERLYDILGFTHTNYMLLKEFYQKLAPNRETAEKLKKEFESRSKMVFIETNVQKYQKKFPLIHDQRFFFREGILDMETKKSPKSSPFYVFLFTDLIVLCKFEKKSKKPITYTFSEMIRFSPKTTTVEDSMSSSYTFTISVTDPKKEKQTFTCTVNSQTEGTKAEWIQSIRDAITDCDAKPDLALKK